jgi:hypothetical protein
MDRNVRGSVLNAYLRFVSKKWGADGVQRCTKDLGLDEEFKDGQYYRDELRENILRWIERIYGPDHIVEAGKFVVKNLGILGWLVRFASPKTLADSFPKNYSEVYTFGQIKVDTSQKGLIRLRLYDVNRIEPSCNSWVGVCEGALEMTNARGKVRKTKCQLKGDVYCEYIVEYEH